MSGPPQRVLIVEDEPNMARTLAKILERKGYEVAMATNGQEALDQLDGGAFQVVVTDLNMPVMDGVAFVREQMARQPVGIVIISIAAESGEQVLAALDA